MIYYTKFSENKVFEDAKLNVFCNQLFTFLINRMDERTVTTQLIIDGHLALLLQKETPVNPFLKVDFSTANKGLFELLQLSVANLDVSQYAFDQDKIIVNNSGVFFEFSLLQYAPMVVDQGGIFIHDKVEILKER